MGTPDWPIGCEKLLRFAVGEREREAVARFLKEAGELGLVAGREARWRTLHDVLVPDSV
jgi:hypothetical protein